jgi:adenylyl-sulfate kinase
MHFGTNVFWLFGRSGAGKTTLARRLHEGLRERKIPVVCLDGDDVRSTVCADLGFQPEARLENHRRIAEMAGLLARQGMQVVVATMAPEYQDRDLVARILGDKLVWFYIHAPLEVCMQRDPKGIYKRAQAGQLKLLLDYPFDTPRGREGENCIDTVQQNIEACQEAVLAAVQARLNGRWEAGG